MENTVFLSLTRRTRSRLGIRKAYSGRFITKIFYQKAIFLYEAEEEVLFPLFSMDEGFLANTAISLPEETDKNLWTSKDSLSLKIYHIKGQRINPAREKYL